MRLRCQPGSRVCGRTALGRERPSKRLPPHRRTSNSGHWRRRAVQRSVRDSADSRSRPPPPRHNRLAATRRHVLHAAAMDLAPIPRSTEPQTCPDPACQPTQRRPLGRSVRPAALTS